MKLLLSVFLVLLTSHLFCQDIIITKTGDEIEAVVHEIGNSEIKYKKSSNISGPMYIISKDEVFMIKYENGTKDVFEVTSETRNKTEKKIVEEHKNNESKLLGVKKGFFSFRYYQGGSKVSKLRFIQALKTDPEAYSHYAGYGINKIAANGFSGLSFLGALIAVSYSINNYTEPARYTAIASLITGIVGSIFAKKASKNLELAVITYNQNLE